MNDFLLIGFDSYVNLNNVKLICTMEPEKLRREMKRRQIEKGSDKYWDASNGKPMKSILLLNDGMLIISALGADTLIKRISELNNGGTLK